jgi:hypothetical protein
VALSLPAEEDRELALIALALLAEEDRELALIALALLVEEEEDRELALIALALLVKEVRELALIALVTPTISRHHFAGDAVRQRLIARPHRVPGAGAIARLLVARPHHVPGAGVIVHLLVGTFFTHVLAMSPVPVPSSTCFLLACCHLVSKPSLFLRSKS